MKKVLFDSDVILDVILQRQPFAIISTLSIDTVASGKVEGYISGHSITNIYYIARRQLGHRATCALLSTLLQQFKVADITETVIHLALKSKMSDFEDAVVSAAAKETGIDWIVTRNISDFSTALVSAITPEVFLNSLEQETT